MSTPETHPKLNDRKSERVPAELQTIVQVKESADISWKEVTKVTTVSRNGAGFCLSKPCTVGRLLTLVMPLPVELRAYDLDSELYPVLGLVQYCNPVTVNGNTKYHVGVGFVGKNVPESFKLNPQQGFRIRGMSADGLWTIKEATAPFKPRKNSRLWLELDVTISLIRRDKKPVVKIDTFTRNVSASGASVVCSLDTNVGDRVKFASKEHNFYAIAVVRNRKETNGLPTTLHLEFVDHEFPMEKIYYMNAARAA